MSSPFENVRKVSCEFEIPPKIIVIIIKINIPHIYFYHDKANFLAKLAIEWELERRKTLQSKKAGKKRK